MTFKLVVVMSVFSLFVGIGIGILIGINFVIGWYEMFKENIFMIVFGLSLLPIIINGLYFIQYFNVLIPLWICYVFYIIVLLLAPFVLVERMKNLEEGW